MNEKLHTRQSKMADIGTGSCKPAFTRLILALSMSALFISGCDMAYAEQDIIDYLIPLIIQAESSGNPNATDGFSYGLMGISDCVIKDFNKNTGANVIVKDLKDPIVNKHIGTWYLRWIRHQLPDKYQNSKSHIIYAYNSGIGKLRKNNWKIPTWTKNHPNRIYRKIYGGEL